jgi:signal transduction histidine kinase
MREASSLVGQKRERGGASRGVQPAPGRPAFQRIAAMRNACQRLRGRPYAESLNELADAILRIFSARMVAVRDGARSDAFGMAPAGVDARDWIGVFAGIESRGDGRPHTSDEGPARISVILPRASWPRASGIEQLVVVPLEQSHGHGALFLGLPQKDPLEQDDLACLDLVGELVVLTLERLQREAPEAPPPSHPLGASLPEIVSIAAHELRTPLTPITMLLQALERKARSGSIDVEAILRTRRQVNRLAQMISDLLDLTRLREGRLEFAPARLDLNACWSQVLSSAEDNLPKHRIELQSAEGPIVVIGDEERMLEASSSLLDHVARLLPTDGAIHVSLQRRADRALITIAGQRRPPPPEVAPDSRESVDKMPLAISVLLARAVLVHFGGETTIGGSHEGGPFITVSLPLAPADTD